MHPLLHPIHAVVGPLHFPTEELVGAFRRRELARGEVWLRAGEVCRRIGLLESGLLRHSRLHGDVSLTRWATLPGQFVTSLPSLNHATPAGDTIEAYEPGVLWELDGAEWRRFRESTPQLQAFWVATLEYVLGCFEDRVWSLVAGDAAGRYAYMLERYPEFLLALPQHFVADMLGIAPRHLSRIRAELAAGGNAGSSIGGSASGGVG